MGDSGSVGRLAARRRPDPVETGMQLADIDLPRLGQSGGAFRHDWFTLLCREAPVWYHPAVEDAPELGGEGFWVVSRLDDARKVSQDWQSYSSEKGGVFVREDFSGQMGVNMMLTEPLSRRRCAIS